MDWGHLPHQGPQWRPPRYASRALQCLVIMAAADWSVKQLGRFRFYVHNFLFLYYAVSLTFFNFLPLQMSANSYVTAGLIRLKFGTYIGNTVP